MNQVGVQSVQGWLLAAFGVACLVLSWGGPPAALAQQAGDTGGDGLFAVTAPGQGQGANVLFLIDGQNEVLMVYEHKAGGLLELTAAKNFRWDRRVPTEFSKQGVRSPEPSFKTMKTGVTKAMNKQDGKDGKKGG